MKECLFDIEQGGKRIKRLFCVHTWSHDPRKGGQEPIIIAERPLTEKQFGYKITLEVMVCINCGRRWFLILKDTLTPESDLSILEEVG